MGSRLQARGFTLIELVMVILLLGRDGDLLQPVYRHRHPRSHGDASRREQLMSDARFAMERLNRELRDAVPGSVQVEASNSGGTRRLPALLAHCHRQPLSEPQ